LLKPFLLTHGSENACTASLQGERGRTEEVSRQLS
jgi:hypothetical protein